MKKWIPEDILQSILESANIRQIVNESVPLKKRGTNWVGLCPFHADKDPSFSVNEDKQIFYCFGCGEGGNAFKFLMKLKGLTFIEAVKELASRYGIEIPERPLSPSQEKRREQHNFLYEVNEAAASFFHSGLTKSRYASRARDYLHNRGMSENIIKLFKIGWAEESWDSLLKHLQEKEFSPTLLEQAGLVVKKKNGDGWYDRFRGRIIFPIVSRQGRTVAFGGRILPETSSSQSYMDQPKYLNSPETEIYHKSRELYGFAQNKSDIRRKGSGYVVEGYMDLLALYAAEVHNVVATLGTALTETHVKFLKGICNDWILLFDGDSAGRKAASRALPFFYKFDLRTKVITLDNKDDPDSFIRREGKESLYRMTETAPSGIDFVLTRGEELYGKDPDGRMKTVEDVITLIEAVTDPVRKSLLADHVARKTGIREETLWERIKPTRGSNKARFKHVSFDQDNEKQTSEKKSGYNRRIKNSAEAKLIGFILGHGSCMHHFLGSGIDIWIEDPLLKDLWNAMLNVYNIAGSFDVSRLFEHLENIPALKEAALKLAQDFPTCNEEERENTLSGLVVYARQRHKKALRMDLLEQMKTFNENEQSRESEIDILRRLQELR